VPAPRAAVWKTSLPPNYRVWMSPLRGTAFFRKDDSHYYLSVFAGGTRSQQIPFVTEKEKDNATIDIIVKF